MKGLLGWLVAHARWVVTAVDLPDGFAGNVACGDADVALAVRSKAPWDELGA